MPEGRNIGREEAEGQTGPIFKLKSNGNKNHPNFLEKIWIPIIIMGVASLISVSLPEAACNCSGSGKPQRQSGGNANDDTLEQEFDDDNQDDGNQEDDTGSNVAGECVIDNNLMDSYGCCVIFCMPSAQHIYGASAFVYNVIGSECLQEASGLCQDDFNLSLSGCCFRTDCPRCGCDLPPNFGPENCK